MARVLVDFPEPEDPLRPKGSRRRAWWRAIKESLAHSGPRVRLRPILGLMVAVMIYHWGLPHVLFNYQSTGVGAASIYTRCEYIGWQSFIARGPYCPVIVWVPWEKLRG